MQLNSEECIVLDGRISLIEQGLRYPFVINGIPETRMRLLDRMLHYHVPGLSVAVIDQWELDWARGYGFTEVGGAPVTRDTLFQAASLSKPVAAAAALRLVQQGRLELDADVNRFLTSWTVPEHPYVTSHPVTLRGLLSHSAGLTVSGFEGYAVDTPLPTLRQVLNGEPPANSAPISVDRMPGSSFRYSGGGYTVLQQLLINALDAPFPTLMHELVLAPLEMTHSTFEQPLPPQSAANAATGHHADGTPINGRWHVYPELAAAGLWTTPSDYARFATALLCAGSSRPSQLPEPEVARMMVTPQVEGFGLGLGLDGTGAALRFSHGGGNAGFCCFVVGFPVLGKGAVVMTNGDSGFTLAQELVRSIAAAYEWPAFRPREKSLAPITSEDTARLAGQYQLEEVSTMVIPIAAVGNRLLVEIPGLGQVELLPESQTTYYALESGLEFVFVQNDASGSVTVTIDQGYGPDLHATRLTTNTNS